MADEEKKTKPKKKKNSKVDTPTIIFFAIMIVGLIVLTVILLTKPTSKIYTKDYGQFVVSVEVYSNNKVDVAVDAGEDRVVQSGTFEEIKDDDVENNYKATFVSEDEETGEKSETVVELVVVDDTLTMNYDDGSQVVLKEKK